MNPRNRRFLIPGLLIVLILVVLITALSREATGSPLALEDDDTHDVVSTINDSDIQESSGLVLSNRHRDLAYTVNDSGNDPVIYAIRVSTGKTVGTTELSGGPLEDTEALSIDNEDNLWVADTGDTDNERAAIGLSARPEPGEGKHSVKAQRYPVTYSNGPQDVEALIINPKTNKKYLVSKGDSGGEVYPLPDTLKTDSANTVKPLDAKAPVLVTDGTFSTDGRYALLRTKIGLHVFDATDWRLVHGQSLPDQEQGETLAMETGGKSILIGSEGEDSQLLRLPFSAESDSPAPTTTTAAPDPSDNRAASSEETRNWLPWGIGAAAVVAATAGGLAIRRRR
ncbi:MAG: hypothetical protein ACXWDH_07280 [Aeromicrobium sp.]